MSILYLAHKSSGAVTQNRLAEAIEAKGSKLSPIQVIWMPCERPEEVYAVVQSADVVIVTVWAAEIKPLNKLLKGIKGKRIVYMEDYWNPYVWHNCRFATFYLVSGVYHKEKEVRESVQAIYPRVGQKPFHFLGHFGYSDLKLISFREKNPKIIFPSAKFNKIYSSLRMQRYTQIKGDIKLSSQIDFLDASAGLRDNEYINHLGLYMGVLVVVPGIDPLWSLVVRKVYECTSVGSLLFMDFGKENSCAKRAMDYLGFIPDIHYLDVTNCLEKISFDEEHKKTYERIAHNGYNLVQARHLVTHRLEELENLCKKFISV